jgi:hypothetical protein
MEIGVGRKILMNSKVNRVIELCDKSRQKLKKKAGFKKEDNPSDVEILRALPKNEKTEFALKQKIDKHSGIYSMAGNEYKIEYNPGAQDGMNYILYKKDGDKWVEHNRYPGMGDIRKDKNLLK